MGFILELIGDLIVDGWFELMQFIIPNKMSSRKLKLFLKVIIYVFSAVLFSLMFIGIFAVISDDEMVHKIGMYMVFIPLAISIVQIIIGLIVKLKKEK